jgi:hypothetical protein
VYINSNTANQWVEFSAYGTPLNGTANVQFADQTISPVYPARPLVLSTGGDLHLNASANVVTFNVVPSNPTISLGASDRPFKNVWISNASIHMAGNGLVSGQPVKITNDANNVVIQSGGLKITGGALQANAVTEISHVYGLNVENSLIASNTTLVNGYIQTPRTANSGANSVAVTIDFANDSIVRCTINADMTVTFTNYITGKTVELWVQNRDAGGGSSHVVTHGVAATNATNGTTTKTIPGSGMAMFRYVSWDGNLANTFVSIHQG